MKMSPLVHIESARESGSGRGELTLRYAAAYACTLIAVLAAQSYTSMPLALVLGSTTLLGWPLSLWMRAHLHPEGVRLDNGVVISRFVINSTIVTMSGLAVVVLSAVTLGGFGPNSLLHLFSSDARGAFGLLMEAILVLACIRCLAILTDKDAFISTLPTYAVLLLLMVVQNGSSDVVLYFFLWMIAALTLLALDHRAEARRGVTGVVPPLVPGQDATLSARALASVVGMSLLCASVLSSVLSGGDPNDRDIGAGMIGALAGRLSGLSMNLPDVSVNAGPERQIDFTSGPSLPTRTELWRVWSSDLDSGAPVTPEYWRLFTYSKYDGHSWSQTGGTGIPVLPSSLHGEEWPVPRSFFFGEGSHQIMPAEHRGGGVNGYALAPIFPEHGGRSQAFGAVPGVRPRRIAQCIVARTENLGFVPILPSPRSIQPYTGQNNLTLRVRDDYAVDVGVVNRTGKAFLWSEVVAPEYGGLGHIPLKNSEQPNPLIRLTAAERARYLLPPPNGFPVRVSQLAKRVLGRASADENNYARAHRLADEIQRGATYTLRPPIPPADRDATDYFLFEGNRRGYCTYFASTLAVMCRASGIPARVVTGFVQPEEKDADGSYVILESMAHAWTEVWVPGWGWATIDATPASDRGNNAPGLWDNALDLLGAVLEGGRNWAKSHQFVLTILGGVLVVLGAIFIAWKVITADAGRRQEAIGRVPGLAGWLRRRRKLTPDEIMREEAMQLYAMATHRLARGFRRRAAWETPSEWLQVAQSALALPDWKPMQGLTELYVRARYSPAPLTPEEVAAVRAGLSDFVWKAPRKN